MADLHIDVSPPQKGVAGHDVRVLGRTEDARRPVGDVDIQVYHNFNSVGTMKTDSHGRAVKVFVGLQPGTHVFELQVLGWARRVRKDVVIPAEPPAAKPAQQKPKRLNRTVSRQDDRSVVSFVVLDENDQPVRSATIRILDGALPKGFVDVTTDKNGSAKKEFRLRPTEQRRGQRWQVLGSDINGFGFLYQ